MNDEDPDRWVDDVKRWFYGGTPPPATCPWSGQRLDRPAPHSAPSRASSSDSSAKPPAASASSRS